ncbi:MAG: hypothetical protein Kow0090_17600 [Myxococcota bacterium]
MPPNLHSGIGSALYLAAPKARIRGRATISGINLYLFKEMEKKAARKKIKRNVHRYASVTASIQRANNIPAANAKAIRKAGILLRHIISGI